MKKISVGGNHIQPIAQKYSLLGYLSAEEARLQHDLDYVQRQKAKEHSELAAFLKQVYGADIVNENWEINWDDQMLVRKPNGK